MIRNLTMAKKISLFPQCNVDRYMYTPSFIYCSLSSAYTYTSRLFSSNKMQLDNTHMHTNLHDNTVDDFSPH